MVSQIIVTGVEDSFILDKSSSTANQTDFGILSAAFFGLTCALKEFATDKNPRDAEQAELKMLLTVGHVEARPVLITSSAASTSILWLELPRFQGSIGNPKIWKTDEWLAIAIWRRALIITDLQPIPLGIIKARHRDVPVTTERSKTAADASNGWKLCFFES